MKRFVWAALAALVVISFAAAAFAQVAGPKFATHIQAHASKPAFTCTEDSPSDTLLTPAIPCTDYSTSYPVLTRGDLYVVIAQADSDGVSGCSFGLEYTDPKMMFGWIPCISGLGFESDEPKWPAPGSGARLTWLLPDDCQNQIISDDGIHAVAGAFYVYAYTQDTFVITPNFTLLSGAELAINNCLGATTQYDTMNVARAGFVDFGGGAGCNPCVINCQTPVEPTTWGQIKNKYSQN